MQAVDLSSAVLQASEAAECKSELANIRWASGFECPSCGNKRAYWIRTRALYECSNRSCKKQTSPTAGTQFHRTRKIDKFWTILKSHGQKSANLSKTAIKRTMAVVAETARRALGILMKSFGNASRPPEHEQNVTPMKSETKEQGQETSTLSQPSLDTNTQTQVRQQQSDQEFPQLDQSLQKVVYLLRLIRRQAAPTSNRATSRSKSKRTAHLFRGAAKSADKVLNLRAGLYLVEVFETPPLQNPVSPMP